MGKGQEPLDGVVTAIVTVVRLCDPKSGACQTKVIANTFTAIEAVVILDEARRRLMEEDITPGRVSL